MDALANFAYSTVSTAPSPGTSGTSLAVAAGQGSRFPATPFNAVVWPNGQIPTPANAEIVRVTARASDTLTLTRTQESTSARAIIAGDQIAAAITAKTLTDITGAISADVVFVSNQNIRRDVTSGYLALLGGSALSETSGAFLRLFGNTNGAVGSAQLNLGNIAGAVFSVVRGDGATSLSIDGATSIATFGSAIISSGDHVFTSSQAIRRDTNDGSDNGSLFFTGGGSYNGNGSRGAILTLSGNEQSASGNIGPGIVGVQIGNVSGSKFYVLGGASATQYMAILGADGSGAFTTSVAGVGWLFTNTSASPFGIDMFYSAAAPNSTSSLFFRARDSGTVRFELRSNGGLANFSANNVNLSDARVKDIQGAAPSQRDVFSRLQFVSARYRDAPETPFDVMLTAQDVQAIYPELVTEFADGHLGVREHGILMRGLKVIQELSTLAEHLDARLIRLEQKGQSS
jgi:hypothetical protein